jgi:CheY-like chemotaxis protein/phosphoribosyl 1,2-cyclic phosphodiesterase
MTEQKAGGARILVAEDVPAMAELMRTWLTSRGYQVELAADGEECLQKAQAMAPALLILDIMLPRIHGIEVLRRLKADPETRALGVIMCTARAYKTDQEQAREFGAFDILTKPVKKEEFLEAIRRYFAGAAQGRTAPEMTAVGEPYLPKISTARSYCRFWGTRGSIPVSGQRYVRHGGNTSCVEIGHGGQRVIVDAGTGIRELGLKLAKQGPQQVDILITHTHWDHIQGFPFFAPAYIPGFELVIYGAAGFRKDLASIFRGQLDRDYFPVEFDDMEANIEFRTLASNQLELGNLQVKWELTQHPSATVGFRFESGGRSLAYVTDNEFLYGYVGAPHAVGLESEVLTPHRRLVELVRGVDLLIGEAQYTNVEYQTKIGWGHSSLSNACALARLAGVKRWIVTHHEPLHEDEMLDHKLNLTKEILHSLDYPIEVIHGFDGMSDYW